MTDKELSIEAMVLIGSLWNHVGSNVKLSFKRPHIITERARKGLDDLTAAGYLTMLEHDNPHNETLYWNPTEKMRSSPKVNKDFIDANSFDLTTE